MRVVFTLGFLLLSRHPREGKELVLGGVAAAMLEGFRHVTSSLSTTFFL